MKQKHIINIFIGIGVAILVGGYLFCTFSNKNEENESVKNEDNQEVVNYMEGVNEGNNNSNVNTNKSTHNETNKNDEQEETEIYGFDGGLEDIPDRKSVV